MSLADVAKAAGYAGPSSVQLYFSNEYEGPLQIGLARRLAGALIGKGEPPIQADDIYSLSEVSLIELDNERYWRIIETHAHRSSPGSEKLQANSSEVKGIPILQGEISSNELFTNEEGREYSIEACTYNFDDPIDYLVLPRELDGDRLYVAFMGDSSMSPRFRIGAPLLVRSVRPPSLGDDVVVLLRPSTEDYADEGRRSTLKVLIKTLVGRSSASVELEQYNPPCRFSVPADQVGAIHRIVPWHELLGL